MPVAYQHTLEIIVRKLKRMALESGFNTDSPLPESFGKKMLLGWVWGFLLSIQSKSRWTIGGVASIDVSEKEWASLACNSNLRSAFHNFKTPENSKLNSAVSCVRYVLITHLLVLGPSWDTWYASPSLILSLRIGLPITKDFETRCLLRINTLRTHSNVTQGIGFGIWV